MRIEHFWEDCGVWFVSFRVKTEIGKKRVINKTIIFDANWSEDEVCRFVLEHFKDIDSIEYLELWNDFCLRPKINGEACNVTIDKS